MKTSQGMSAPGASELDEGSIAKALATAPSPVAIFQPLRDEQGAIFDYRIAYENDAFKCLFGRSGDAALLLSAVKNLGERDGFFSRLCHVSETGKPVTSEVRVERGDSVTWLSCQAARCSQGVVVDCADVTALLESRFRAEELAWELAEEQELYRATFTDAPVGIAHLDLQGRFTEVNERLVQLLGFERDELLTMNFADLRHLEEDELRPETWAFEELHTREGRQVERRYLSKDGRTVWTTVTVSPVRDRTGNAKRLIAIIEDVSGLARANQRLEQSSRSKDEFLAVLGHELRNPLAALRHASMLLTDHGTDAELRRVVSIVDRQTKQMGRLVDDLLDVGRIARGKLDFRVEQVDVHQIVQFALDDLDSGAPPAQTIEVDLQEGPLWIEGDSARLLQAVQNLLSNAVKYTPPDGHIWVELRANDERIVFSVRDDGVGLTESFADKLFLPFEQEPQDLSRSQGGLGLGLALTSQIVEHHGGNITADSLGRGEGATFVIELPRTKKPQVAESSTPPHEVRRYRFLVVEDNTDAAELLKMLLSARGHEVQVCASGDRALDAALGQSPDVVLCDLGLPGLSGYEVAEQIGASEKLQHAILIALSGYGRAEDVERCEEVGFAAHLTKPVDVNEIFSELERLAVRKDDGPAAKER